MIISEINQFSIWQKYFEDFGAPSFLQSWEWGEVQSRLGYTVSRIGLFEKSKDEHPVAITQIIKIRAKRGSFLFIPHGPLYKPDTPKEGRAVIYYELTQYLQTIAKKEKFGFIRIAPGEHDSEEGRQILNDVGYRLAPIYMHAERMWVLPVTPSEEELLAEMRKTTRYSIKKAEREGVHIEIRTDQEASEEFLKLYQKTAEREHFSPFSKKFILAEYEEFQKTGNAVYLLAKHRHEYLAGALILFTKKAGFYHQGASVHSKIPAPYRLQWEAIKLAKSRGCTLYNFWGILQEGRTPKSWEGLSLFKKGFGGHQVDYMPTMDCPCSKSYMLTSLYERILAKKRGV